MNWAKDYCKTRRDSFKFCDLVTLILKILWYVSNHNKQKQNGPCEFQKLLELQKDIEAK